ncbi:MAG: hypothetical protein U0R79_00830 [Propionicimonas sp.]
MQEHQQDEQSARDHQEDRRTTAERQAYVMFGVSASTVQPSQSAHRYSRTCRSSELVGLQARATDETAVDVAAFSMMPATLAAFTEPPY